MLFKSIVGKGQNAGDQHFLNVFESLFPLIGGPSDLGMKILQKY